MNSPRKSGSRKVVVPSPREKEVHTRPATVCHSVSLTIRPLALANVHSPGCSTRCSNAPLSFSVPGMAALPAASMPAADRNYSSRPPDAQARYHEHVAMELVDYVDSHYRTIASQQGRAIGGISMGGRIAVMTALQYPARFGVVGALSPAVRMDADEAVQKAEGSVTYFYVSCGTADALLPANREFVAQLTQHHLMHDFKEIQGGEHSWSVWDPELGTFFDLLGTREPWGRTRRQ